jgi:hypothetical protein
MKLLKKIKELNNTKTKEFNSILNIKKNNKKNLLIDFVKNGNDKYIALFENKKLILSGKFNFYGIYQPTNKLWIWASSIPGVENRHLKNIITIRKSANLFEGYDDPIINFYYQLLTQDMLIIDSNEKLQYINMLLLYLSNDVFYFNPMNSTNNIQFITMSEVKEKYI